MCNRSVPAVGPAKLFTRTLPRMGFLDLISSEIYGGRRKNGMGTRYACVKA